MLGRHAQTTAIPDLIEPIVGWRAWEIRETDEGPELVSPDRRTPWPVDAPIEAVFVAEGDERVTSHCGINAYAEEREILRSHYLLRCPVWGQVNMWGEVRSYDKGWRAELAYPRQLFIADCTPNVHVMALALSARYGVECDVVEASEQQRAVHEHNERIGVLNGLIAAGEGNDRVLRLHDTVRANSQALHPIQMRSRLPVEVCKGNVVLARDAHVLLNGDVMAHAYGQAYVIVNGTGNQLMATGSCRVATAGSTLMTRDMITLRENARGYIDRHVGDVRVRDQATATLRKDARASVCDEATVYAYEQSWVHASGQATVHAWGNSTVHVHGKDVTVHLHDDAVVHDHHSAHAAMRDRTQGNRWGLPQSWDVQVDADGWATLYVSLAVSQTVRIKADDGKIARNEVIMGADERLRELLADPSVTAHASARDATWNFCHPDDRLGAVRVRTASICCGSSKERQAAGWVWEWLGYCDEDGELLPEDEQPDVASWNVERRARSRHVEPTLAKALAHGDGYVHPRRTR